MKTKMKSIVRVLMVVSVFLAGCQATHNVATTSYHVTRGAAVGSYKVARAVAVGSYRVASAPVYYATRKGTDEPTMVGTTEATPSDVTEPGQPIPRKTASERRQSRTSSGASRTTRKETAQSSTRAGSSRPSASQENFPTAKAVPGKSGYVFSPFDTEGRYVDVSGFAPGTKVKDPWTDKIFLVP
jgi:hypothetical protein